MMLFVNRIEQSDMLTFSSFAFFFLSPTQLLFKRQIINYSGLVFIQMFSFYCQIIIYSNKRRKLSFFSFYIDYLNRILAMTDSFLFCFEINQLINDIDIDLFIYASYLFFSHTRLDSIRMSLQQRTRTKYKHFYMRQTRQKERKKDFSRFRIRKNMFALRLIMVDCVHVNLPYVFYLYIKRK